MYDKNFAKEAKLKKRKTNLLVKKDATGILLNLLPLFGYFFYVYLI